MTEREIFLVALELTAPAARAAYLEGACSGDSAMRRKVEELLKEHFSDDHLLAGPAVAGRWGDTLENSSLETSARRIGRYKLLEKIGEGGMGEVWMAEQDKPVGRRVALKLIKMGLDTRSVIARFEAEGPALAWTPTMRMPGLIVLAANAVPEIRPPPPVPNV